MTTACGGTDATAAKAGPAPTRLRGVASFAALAVCAAAAVCALLLRPAAGQSKPWSVRVPLEIGAIDGLLVAKVVQRQARERRRASSSSSSSSSTSSPPPPRDKSARSPKKTLRLGVDTGSSLTWGCDATCRVLVERRDSRIPRRRFVVRNTSTRHKTLLQPVTTSQNREAFSTGQNSSVVESFRVKFADGTRIRGAFRYTTLSLKGEKNHVAASQQEAIVESRFDFGIKIAAAHQVRENLARSEAGLENTVPRFESGSVDGYLGLGIASNPKYPSGHAAWDQLRLALNVTHGNEPTVLSVGINVKTPPFTMTITKSTTKSNVVLVLARVPLPKGSTHWSAIVQNVRLTETGKDGPVLYPKARVHFDTGASSIFVPKDALRHDGATPSWSMNLAFQVETEGAERIPVEIFARDLRINQTLHASLVSKGRGAVHGEVANGEDPRVVIDAPSPFKTA